MIGRTAPSSQTYHEPSMRIDPGHPFPRNDAGEQAVVVRMGGLSEGESFRRGVGDEQFLPCDTEAFAAMRPVDLGCVRGEPTPVPLEALVLSVSACQLAGVSHFLHRDSRSFSTRRRRFPQHDFAIPLGYVAPATVR